MYVRSCYFLDAKPDFQVGKVSACGFSNFPSYKHIKQSHIDSIHPQHIILLSYLYTMKIHRQISFIKREREEEGKTKSKNERYSK